MPEPVFFIETNADGDIKCVHEIGFNLAYHEEGQIPLVVEEGIVIYDVTEQLRAGLPKGAKDKSELMSKFRYREGKFERRGRSKSKDN